MILQNDFAHPPKKKMFGPLVGIVLVVVALLGVIFLVAKLANFKKPETGTPAVVVPDVGKNKVKNGTDAVPKATDGAALSEAEKKYQPVAPLVPDDLPASVAPPVPNADTGSVVPPKPNTTSANPEG